MSDYPMLISNKLHSFRNFGPANLHFCRIFRKRNDRPIQGLSLNAYVWTSQSGVSGAPLAIVNKESIGNFCKITE